MINHKCEDTIKGEGWMILMLILIFGMLMSFIYFTNKKLNDITVEVNKQETVITANTQAQIMSFQAWCEKNVDDIQCIKWDEYEYGR